MRRTTLILSLALAVSVAVNMLLGGLIAGHHWGDPPRHRSGDFLFDRAFSAVPEELRGPIRERLRPEGSDLRMDMREMRDARRAVDTALRARPFDPAAADAALAALRAKVGETQSSLHATVVGVMAEAQANGTLPPPPEPKRRDTRERERNP